MASINDFEIVMIKPIEKGNLPDLIGITKEEGWDLELHELEFFHVNYGEHMYGTFNTQDQMLGHVLARPISKSCVLVEMVITHKQARGKGVGKALMNFVLTKYNGYNICLLPVVGKEGFYAKFGFCMTEIRILKFMRPLGVVPELFQDGSTDVKVVTSADDIKKVLSYKKTVHGFESELYLSSLCNKDPSTVSLYALKDNTIKGFIIVRSMASWVRVCCFYADDVATAKHLLFACSQKTKPGIRYKFACPNRKHIVGLFEGLWGAGFDNVPMETLMTTKGECKDDIDWERIYSVLETTLMMFV